MASIGLSELVPLLEERLSIASGTFEALDSEDESDWSFIIKLHSLIESAVSFLLTEHLGHSSLSDVFSRLDMSNKATGKYAFIKALGLLNESERRFISSLSEIRNKLVHDIRNINYDLAHDVESKDKRQKEQFVHNFNLIETTLTEDVRELFLSDPRQALWYSSMAFLGVVYLKIRK